MDPMRLANSSAGLIGAIVGLCVLQFAPLDDLLPLNQVLFALDCALIAIWATLAAAQHWGQGP